CMQALEYPLTS
nr:immunoglobulin light chain junction region [Macaca mulatta]